MDEFERLSNEVEEQSDLYRNYYELQLEVNKLNEGLNRCIEIVGESITNEAVNNKLEEAIEDSKVVMSQKDSIIDLKSSIILNQEIGYTAEIKGLQKSLKKEKVKKTVWISVLGAVAATLGVLSVVGR